MKCFVVLGFLYAFANVCIANEPSGYPCFPALNSASIEKNADTCQALLKSPDLPVRAYILVDFYSGQVLAAKNKNMALPPASLAKIMTTYVAAQLLAEEKINLLDSILISKHAYSQPGSRTFVDSQATITLENLLKGMIVQSGNDASVAIAEHIAGSEALFVDLMNKYATKLGMTQSNFANSTGLPDETGYVSARDIAKLAQVLISNHPEVYAWHSMRSFTFNGITQRNRNRLLFLDDRVDGIKTGYTSEAGYSLVSSAQHENGMRLIAVVLGAKNALERTEISRQLLKYGFAQFNSKLLYKKRQEVKQVKIWKGEKELLSVGVTQDFYYVSPKLLDAASEARISIFDPVVAPVQIGDLVGEIIIYTDDRFIAKTPLIALTHIEQGSWWKRFIDGFRLR